MCFWLVVTTKASFEVNSLGYVEFKESRNGMGMESGNGNYQLKMPDKDYHVNIQVKFIAQCFFVRFLDRSALFNCNDRNSLIELSPYV